jgi:hypothetical protein
VIKARTGLSILVGTISMAASSVVLAPSAAAENSIGSCGVVHASIPYSHQGNHDRWRVYVRGHASCASAKRVLNAVMHLNATEHLGSSDATSYFSYHGWRCPFGNMGFQSCVLPSHRPYRAAVLAIDCAIASGGCPSRVPATYFP